MKKISTGKKVLIVIISIILTLVIAAGSFFAYTSSKINKLEIDSKNVTDTGQEPPKESNNVITIALFGTDYMGEEIGASDTTMILSIDKNNNKVKLGSLMRDMYLDLPKGGKGNLNYTMSDDGYEGILKTINSNFNLKVDKFVEVNLNNLPKVIDTLGGVEINITNDEIPLANKLIDHIDGKNGTSTKKLTKSGKQVLNGTQASAYCRIRSTSGGDFKRSSRQREILEALFTQLKNTTLTSVPGIINQLLPLVTTNLSNSEILSISSTVLGMGVSNIDQATFPLEGDYTTEWTDMYHINIDKEKTTNEIHKFLFSIE